MGAWEGREWNCRWMWVSDNPASAIAFDFTHLSLSDFLAVIWGLSNRGFSILLAHQNHLGKLGELSDS